MTYTEILRLLRQGGVEAAEFEARQILRQYGDVEEALCLAVERRLQGEPLQYIFGEWEFRGLRMLVDSNVLIPRADTELLVDTALELLAPQARVLELGAGSGCVSVSLALEGMQVSACDISPQALQVAAKNADLHQVCVHFFEGDMRKGSGVEQGPWNAVISNPPYFPANAGGGPARSEVHCSFEELCITANRLLKTGGRFSFVHRPERLTDLLCTLRAHRLEPKRLRFVTCAPDRSPSALLIEAVKNGGAGLEVLPPLITL